MTGDSDTPTSATMMDKLVELTRDGAPAMTVQQQGRGLAVVLARLEARAHQRGRSLRTGALGLAATAAVGVFLFALLHRPKPLDPPAIRYHAESGEILDGGYLRAFDDKGMVLRFSEGTRLELLPGARGRLRSVDASGARFAIEQGPARIAVTHRPGAHWQVDAGPFLISVRGTVFTVAWNPASEQLDLRMEKGLVSVTGPVSEAGIAVRGGQRLTIDLPKKEVLLRELGKDTQAKTPAVAAGRPETVPAKPAPESAATERPARAATRTHGPVSFGWAAAMAAGQVDEILEDVQRIGLKRALAQASSDDLSALADAARYRKQDDLAEQALLGQRSRFPDSARARDAAFLLGRLEESHEGGGLRALDWYDSYLQSNSTGAYASEALGRKMIVTQKLMGAAAASAVATDYLERFPSGTYAGAARAFQQAP
jgi:hypothetical protein